MELALLVYAVSLLDSLHTLVVFICGISTVIAIVSGICLIETYNNSKPSNIKWLKRGCIVGASAAVIGTFIPSERTAYIMVAAYAAQKVAESPEVRDTGDRVLTLINSKLDQLILEAQTPKKGK